MRSINCGSALTACEFWNITVSGSGFVYENTELFTNTLHGLKQLEKPGLCKTLNPFVYIYGILALNF